MFLLQLIILQVLIFGGLIFALRVILTKNISSATSHLDDLHADFVKREEEVKKRQAEAEKYYEDMIAKAKDEAEKFRQEADRSIQEERDKILEEARLQSEAVIAKAEKTRDMLTNELRQEIEADNIGRLRELIKSVFPARVQEEVHKMWLEDLMNGDLSKLSSMRIASSVTEAKVVCAFALSGEQRGILKKKFKEQLNREFSFQEEVDPSLIGGVVITVGNLVLDGSVVNRIEQNVSPHA